MSAPRRPDMLNERKRKGFGTYCLTCLLALLLLLLAAFTAFNLWVGENCFIVQVSGQSMEKTFYTNDLVYAYQNAEAKRGDVVIIDTSESEAYNGDRIIKRLIATEGDKVKCEGGVVYLCVAGGEYESLKEPYANGVTEDFDEVTVGEGEIFFMGDNRNPSMSKDARITGCLAYTDIVGVVPAWAISIKSYTTAWESFRLRVIGSVVHFVQD